MNKLTNSLIGSALLLASSFPAAEESPWLLVPTISNDPKLGFKGGVMGGHMNQFDPESNYSMIAGFANYSNTDSYTGGIFASLYWDANRNKLKAGVVRGQINNDYEDYLGSGQNVKTEDDIKGLFARYSRLIYPNWYLGFQAVSSNYAIGADEIPEGVVEQIGLTGFESNGIGLALEYDKRDDVRNTTQGQYFLLHNIAYREWLGGEESFDVFQEDYRYFQPFGEGHVFALQVQGRWTQDAPQSGYSSIQLRGYTRGNYLDKNYTHLDMEARLKLHDRWGATVFAGFACLYSSLGECDKGEHLYPSGGVGLTYLLKPKAGIIIKAEYAVGEDDNSAFYLKLGQAF